MKLNYFTKLEHCTSHTLLTFSNPQRVISSAILNGGVTQAAHIINLKVPKVTTSTETPADCILNYALTQKCQGTIIGMMTAASMNSLRIKKVSLGDIELAAIVTTGLSNARRAGDKADVQELLCETTEIGTINLIIVCTAKLTDAAMVEAIITATEAKTVALQNAKIISPISKLTATGTGTDAIAIVSGNGPEEIAFCGKHVLLGEKIAQLVIEAITSSITTSSEKA